MTPRGSVVHGDAQPCAAHQSTSRQARLDKARRDLDRNRRLIDAGETSKRRWRYLWRRA
jgi:hypothetical protein